MLLVASQACFSPGHEFSEHALQSVYNKLNVSLYVPVGQLTHSQM